MSANAQTSDVPALVSTATAQPRPDSVPERVPITDSDGTVTIYCEERDSYQSIRGVIATGKDVLVTNGRIIWEIVWDKCNELAERDLRSAINDAVRVTYAVEGVTIYVFYHENKWYTCTNRKIDAFKSFWARKELTFGLTFAKKLALAYDHPLKDDDDITPAKAADLYNAVLDKNVRHVFISPFSYSERIGSKGKLQTPVLIKSFTLDGQEAPLTNPRLAPETVEYERPSDVFNTVRDIDPDYHQGVIITTPTGDVKILNAEYQRRYDLRGNSPSLRARYLGIRRTPLAEPFLVLYPEVDAGSIEVAISDLTQKLAMMAKDRREYDMKVDRRYAIILDIVERWFNACTYSTIERVLAKEPVLLNKALRFSTYENDQMQKMAAAKKENDANEATATAATAIIEPVDHALD